MFLVGNGTCIPPSVDIPADERFARFKKKTEIWQDECLVYRTKCVEEMKRVISNIDKVWRKVL